MSNSPDRPVLILGAGINGAALARELALNGVPVVIVDTGDIGGGTSAYSSRLIHGGLRYLEYREFDLVRESLDERNRLLQLAPQFVRPLRLYIPVRNRFGSALTQAARFLGLPAPPASAGRGLYVVQAGLWMYDRYAKGDVLPPQSVHRPGEAGAPHITAADVHWLCAYSDAQILRTERFVIALLRDAAEIAQARGVAFTVLTYHEATRDGEEFVLRPVGHAGVTFTVRPQAIVNATGAWVDETLARLKISGAPLLGGTKGSHFLTFHAGLRAALQEGGIYAEAADGRPFFVLPWGEGTLVGTTDLPFDGDPATATATEAELEYLLAGVGSLFPDLKLIRDDIALHYAGVRPLPRVAAGAAAGITRRHLWHWHAESKTPMVSLIGGKLTTCRAFAEQTTAQLLPKLGLAATGDSRDRPLSGYADLRERRDEGPMIADTNIPAATVRWSIQHEWTTTLNDLVERRLLLQFEPQLTLATLKSLAAILVSEDKLPPSDVASVVEQCQTRLLLHFGRNIDCGSENPQE